MCWCWDKLSNSDGAKQNVCQTMTKCRFSSSYKADDEATCEGDDFQMFARTTVHIQDLLNTLIKSSQWHLMCLIKVGWFFSPEKMRICRDVSTEKGELRGRGLPSPPPLFKKKKKKYIILLNFHHPPSFFIKCHAQ